MSRFRGVKAAGVCLVLLAAAGYGVYRNVCASQVSRALARVSCDGVTFLYDGALAADVDVIHLDTYHDRSLTHAEIERTFDCAVADLTAKARIMPVYLKKTDQEGFSRICALWLLPSGYAEVGAGSGNDADFLYVRIGTPMPASSAAESPARREDLPKIFAR